MSALSIIGCVWVGCSVLSIIPILAVYGEDNLAHLKRYTASFFTFAPLFAAYALVYVACVGTVRLTHALRATTHSRFEALPTARIKEK